MRSRTGPAVALALPGLLLAVAGLFHPHHLSYDTSRQWYVLHLPGLVLFPLVGVAFIVLVRGRHEPLAWVVRLTAYGYAVFYSGLDVVNGIAAGYLTHAAGGRYRGDAVPVLFDIGRPLGEIGGWALVAACLALAVDQVARHRLSAVAGLVLLPGAWFVRSDHIFAPVGVIGMALIGVGTGYLAWLENPWRGSATSATLDAS